VSAPEHSASSDPILETPMPPDTHTYTRGLCRIVRARLPVRNRGGQARDTLRLCYTANLPTAPLYYNKPHFEYSIARIIRRRDNDERPPSKSVRRRSALPLSPRNTRHERDLALPPRQRDLKARGQQYCRRRGYEAHRQKSRSWACFCGLALLRMMTSRSAPSGSDRKIQQRRL
jgi:hypothetical protein